MAPEARLESTEHGLVPKGDGWFVLNAREARWRPAEGRGAGDASCLVLAAGARDLSTGPDWGAYNVDEAALRHGTGVEHETTDPEQAYERFPPREPSRYRDGWLPE
jgi:hypothetical protein